MNKICKTCYWADYCPDLTDDCQYYSPLENDINDLVDYAFDLLDRANTYQELIDEMRDDD